MSVNVRNDEVDNITTNQAGIQTVIHNLKSPESIIIADWVRKGLFKFCKFVTSSESLEYRQPFCLFAISENNIISNEQIWWRTHKKDIVKTLNEKRGCVVENIKNLFKSK